MIVLTVVTVGVGTGYLIRSAFGYNPLVWRRWSRRWARWIARGVGWRVQATYETPIAADRPYVFVSNHQSAADILVHILTMPVEFGFLAKGELERAPVLGSCLRRSPCLFVDRSTPRRARASLAEAARRIREGTSVLIYPEGERTYGTAMAPFRRGAFALSEEAGVPVVPVTLVDAYRVCHLGRRRLWPGTVSVHYGAPIETAAFPADGGEAMRDHVRRLISAQLNRVTSSE